MLDTLLRDDVHLRGSLRVFCMRSAEVNAYTTNDGKIFLTLGLLARLENRNELAFVLAHEVQHYLHGDVYESFLFNRRLTKRMRTLGKSQEGAEQLLRSRYSRSRQQEIAADSSAILLYRSSPFGAYDPARIFDVLASSDRAIYPDAPAGDFFFAVPGEHQDIFAVGPEDLVVAEHGNDTSFATHPAIEERRGMLRAMGIGTSWQVMGRDVTYEAVRTMAGFELANTCYIDGDHERALIQVNGLLREFPGNRFLMELSVKCLMALADGGAAEEHAVAEGDTVNDRVTAAFQSAMARMTRPEFLAAVIHRCALLPDARDDMDLRHIMEMAAWVLAKDERMPATDSLSSKRMKDNLAAFNADLVASALLRQEDAKQTGGSPGPSTGNGHVVIPFIFILDTLGRPHALEPQRAFARYCRDIERISASTDLQVRALSSFGLDSTDTQAYNDFCFYQDQLQAYMTSEGEPLVLDRDRLRMIGERHNARYLTLSFVLMTKNRFTFKLGRWGTWAFLIPGGPGALFGLHCFFYKYTGKHFTVVYDLWTGKQLHTDFSRKRSYMRAHPKGGKLKKFLSTLAH